MLLARAGREDEARQHLEKAIAGDPSLLQTRAILASLDTPAAAGAEIQLTGHEVAAPASK